MSPSDVVATPQVEEAKEGRNGWKGKDGPSRGRMATLRKIGETEELLANLVGWRSSWHVASQRTKTCRCAWYAAAFSFQLPGLSPPSLDGSL